MIRVPIGAVLLLILLLIAWPWVTEPPPAPALAGFALQGDADNPVVRVEVVYASGEVVAFYPAGSPVATATPDATNTPVPSNTPRPTATHTPTATVTPLPTHTPVATATPLPFLTPTPEATLVPATPGPTPPPPPETYCWGGALYNVRVRVEPSVSAAHAVGPDGKLVWWYATERRVITSLLIVHPEGAANREEWGQLPDGTWAALWYAGTELIRLDDTPPCWELEPPRTAWGIWAGPGASLDELLQFGRTVQAAGITPAATVYGTRDLVNPLHDAGFVVAYRPWLGDCGDYQLPPEIRARARVGAAVQDTAGLRYDWLVLENECIYPDMAYVAAYVTEVGLESARRGIPQVVPLVWYSGAPELADVPALVAAYDVEGVTLGWGCNTYPVTSGVALDDLGRGAWTTYRPLMYLDQLGNTPLIITEFARGDGSEPPRWDEYPRFILVYNGRADFVTAWYMAGPAGLGHWAQANIKGQGPAYASELTGAIS